MSQKCKKDVDFEAGNHIYCLPSLEGSGIGREDLSLAVRKNQTAKEDAADVKWQSDRFWEDCTDRKRRVYAKH